MRRHQKRRKSGLKQVEQVEERAMLSGLSLGFATGYEADSRSISPLKVAVAGDGDVYSTGRFRQTVDFDPGPGVFELTGMGAPAAHVGTNANAYITRFDSNGRHLKSIAILSEGNVVPIDFVADMDGNLVVTGSYEQDADFDGSAGDSTLITNQWRTFVAKYDADLNLVWSRRLGGEGGSYARSLDTDGDGDIYLGGSFHGTVDFDPGTDEQKRTGRHDAFVLALNKDGEFKRVHVFYGTDQVNPTYEAFRVEDVDADEAGNLAIIGSFQGTIDIDPSEARHELNATGNGLDVFVARFNPAGRMTWAGHIGGRGLEADGAIRIDPATDDLVIAYGTRSRRDDTQPAVTDVDPAEGTDFRETPVGGLSSFITRVSASGNYRWTIQLERPVRMNYSTQYSKIEIDDQSNVYAAGFILTNNVVAGDADFDPLGNGYNVHPADVTKPFLARWNRDGKLSSFLTPESGGAVATRVLVDADRSVYLTMSNVEQADLDPGPGTHVVSGGSYIWKLEQSPKVFLPETTIAATLVRDGDEVTLVDETDGRVLFRQDAAADELVIDAKKTEGVSFTVDHTEGPIETRLKLVGSSVADELKVVGTDNVQYRPQTNSGSQSKLVVDGQVINFVRFESIALPDASTFTLRTNASADTVGFGELEGGTQIDVASGETEFPSVILAEARSIIVDTQGGADTITVPMDKLSSSITNLQIRSGYGSDNVKLTDDSLNPREADVAVRLVAGAGLDVLRVAGNGDYRLLGTALVNDLVASPIRFSSVESAHLSGGPTDNKLDGSLFNGPVTLRGHAGDDTLIGSRHDDKLVGDDGDDSIRGGRGNDLLQGSAGHDRLVGDDGDDTLAGGGGADSLDGGRGEDSLTGGNGADTLFGGAGSDFLNGGNSDDLFLVAGTNRADVLHVRAGSQTTVVRVSDGSDELLATIFAEGDDSIAIDLLRGRDEIVVEEGVNTRGSISESLGDDLCDLPAHWVGCE